MKNIFLFIFLALLFSGCGNLNIGEKEKTTVNPSPQLILEYIEVDYSYDRPEIHLSLKNVSSERLWFPVNLNTKISYFNEENKKWELVHDLIQHSSIHNETILEPKEDLMHSDIFLIISPDIPIDYLRKSKTINLRVEVFGIIMDSETTTTNPVTAGTEFILKNPLNK